MDNVIAEESADGEHKVRVREEEEETVNEAIGGVVVEESTDGGHKVQLGDEETPKETVCNAIVKESTDGEHKVQVGDDETLNETTGNAVVEESADGKHKARARADDALNETMGDIIVKESSDGKHKAPAGKKEALNETKGDIIAEESTDGEHKAQVGEDEALIETMGDIIVEESTDDEHKAQVMEEVVLTETVGVAVVEESTEGEHQAQVREEEALSETTGDAIVEESNDDEHKAQVREDEVLNETTGDDIVEESYDVEHRGQVKEEEALNETMGNAIVEESTSGEHKAQVVEAEASGNVIIVESTDVEHTAQVREAETMGDVLVEESSNVEHKTQVGEADALTEIIGDVIMEESTAAKHKARVGEAEALTEIIGDVIMEETTAGEHKAQVREAEASTETIDDVIMEESTVGEHKAKVSEAEVLTETTGNVVIVEGTDGEHKAQVGGEVLSEIEKHVIQYTASETRIISPMEVGQQVTYHLPSLDKANFSISDLVWGKVKSHPWWPGQIFDPSDASTLAMKYQKKDSFLIAYYGDKTFAWCDESQLKPFHSYFSQLEKQCSSDTFIKAIHDILMEVSSRVELGMACSCLPKEDYTKIKYQKVDNAGIRGGNINSIINRSTVANCFEPEKLLEYIKTLAQFPNGRVDKLEFVIAQSQLKAFYHSRGYPELPVFIVSGGLMECVPENSPSSGKGSTEDFVEQCTPVCSHLISATEMSKNEKSSFNKREHGVEGDVKQKSTSKLAEDGKAVHLANGGKAKSVAKAVEKPISSFSGKKHIISKLVEDGKAVHLANGGKAKSVAKAAEKPISSFSGKKHVIVESDPTDSGRCKKRMLDSFKDIEFKSPSLTGTSSFKIGEFIRRAASQLTGGPPIIKCQGETLQKDGPQADHMIDDVADFDVPPDSPVENQRTNLSFIEDYNSPDELLSQLCLAAKDPMEEYSFVPTIVDFFTGFRNFCVSSSSEEKEHVEKRKRGRPKKVISQQAASDIITSEDENHVEKRKRGLNVISQLASSDISSENEKPVEKPVEKRKRGRPRKNPLPASSDSEDMKPLQKPKRGRPRGRPSKVDSQLPSPDNSSFENKKLVETRKRRRPRKVISQIVPTDMTTPDHMKDDHMKDSYWSDMDLKKKSNGRSLIQYQKKRRKSTGEQSLCQLTPTLEEQLQLAMNPDMKLTFVPERSIISVEEKIVDECMPTALILVFNNANSLPSETHLIRIFSRYGPLKEAETEVLTKTNRAKVVFKRRVDAEAAFSSAGKYSIFGPGLLSYQLKPWSPKSTLQAVPLGTQEAAPAAMPEDTHDAARIVTPANTLDTEPITMPQDNLDAAFIPTPEDKHDLAPVIAAQDYHDLAPISVVQDSHDTAQDKCPNAGVRVGSNLVLSEHAETVITSDSIQVEAEGRGSSGKRDHPELISHENQDPVVVASLLVEHNVPPTSAEYNVDAATITMVQDIPDAAVVITLQNKCDAKPTVGSNMELSEQAEDVIASDTIQVEAESKESSPLEKHGPGLIAAPEEKQDAVPIASPLDENDLIPTSTEDKLDTALNTMLEDGRDAAAVITPQDNLDAVFIPTPEDKHDLVPVITAQDYHDLPPISMVQDNHDTAQDKCPNAGIYVGSNLVLSEHAETVIASDCIQVEAEGRGSSGKRDHPELISHENKDPVVVASLLDEHNLTPTSTEDNVDAATITMVQDNPDAAVVIALQIKCDAKPTVGSNMGLSEQAEDVIASNTIQVEAESMETSPHEKHGSGLIAALEEKQDAVPIASPLDEHDLIPTSTEDKLDAAPNTMLEDGHDVAAVITPQDNLDAAFVPTPEDKHDLAPVITAQDYHDLAPTSMVQDNHGTAQDKCPNAGICVGSNFVLSEHAETVIASDSIQVEAEGRGSSGKHDQPELIFTSHENQDPVVVASLLDEHNLTPTGAEDNVDAATITMVQDNPDAAVVVTLQNKCDAKPIVGSNMELSEQAGDVIASNTIQVEAESKESSPHEKHGPGLIAAPKEKQDAVPIAYPLDEHDLTPTSMEDKLDAAPSTMVEDGHDTAAVITPQDKFNAGSTVGRNLELSEQAEDVIASDTVQIEVEGEESSPHGKYEPALIAAPEENLKDHIPQQAEDVIASDTIQVEADSKESSPHEKHGSGLIIAPEEKQDAVPMASPLVEHDLTLTSTEDKLDASPNTMVEDNHDVTAVIMPQDKCNAGPTVGRNLELSEQAEDSIQMDVEGEGSSPHDKYEPSPIAAPEENQDVLPVASPQDEDDSTPINTQDNLDGAPITMVENNPDATHILKLPHKYDAVPVAGSNLEFSERVEAVVVSDATQVEAKGKESLPQYSQEPALTIAPQQNQNEEPCTSLLDQHDSTPTTTHDNLDAMQISLPQDNHDATSSDTPQDNQDAEPFASLPQDNPDAAPAPITKPQDNQDAAPISTLQEKCDAKLTVGSKLSEQVEDVVASNTIQVEAEGKESFPQDKLNPALITTLQQNQDSELIAALLDKHDSIPSTTQADLDAASICTPQDNQDVEPTASLPHGTAPITIPQDNRDAVSITTPPDNCDVITPITASQDNHNAAPIATAQDKHDLGPIIPAEDSRGLAPMTSVEVNRDAADVVALQDKEQADGAVASDTIHVEAEGKESPPQDGHVPAPIAIPQQNQDPEHVASLLDKHDSIPATTQDNVDAASITMVPDNHAAAPITMPKDKYNAALAEGCNIQVSEQTESGVTSETMQAEGEGCNLEVSEQVETITASDAMQI